MPVKNCCFKGRGNVALADYEAFTAGTAGLIPVGNAPLLEISLNENVERVPDYTSAAGGTACVVRTIETADVKLTLACNRAENLALALYGSGSTGNKTATAVASEPHVAWPGALVPLADMPDLAQPITVKAATGATVYIAGTDYLVTAGGAIQILPGSSIPTPTINMGAGQPNIMVSYQRAEHSAVELFTRTSLPVVLAFDGVNVVDARPVNFQLYRVRFGPATNMTVIGDNISKLELSGEIERDNTKPIGTPGNRLSQYGTLKI